MRSGFLREINLSAQARNRRGPPAGGQDGGTQRALSQSRIPTRDLPAAVGRSSTAFLISPLSRCGIFTGLLAEHSVTQSVELK